MKSALVFLAVLVGGCAAAPPPPPVEQRRAAPVAADYNQDMTECERLAALAGAGERARAFAECMKARKHAPKR